MENQIKLMEIKEKAEELIGKYRFNLQVEDDLCKIAAIIAVNEILNAIKNIFHKDEFWKKSDVYKYWENVKKEIEKL